MTKTVFMSLHWSGHDYSDIAVFAGVRISPILFSVYLHPGLATLSPACESADSRKMRAAVTW